MEYCGEVCTPADFEQRKLDYVQEKRRHYYFMSLKTDEVGVVSSSICDVQCKYLMTINYVHMVS